MALLVLADPAEQLALRGLQALVLQVLRDPLVLVALKEIQVQLAHRDHLGHQEQQDPVVHQAL